MDEVLERITKAIIEGDTDNMVALTQSALAKGIGPQDVLNQGLMPGMDYVGAEFRKGNRFVPEVLLSAQAMQISMNILKPLLVKAGAKMTGKVVMGTVEGDLHDIGKNLVCMMLEGAGFEVVDLGHNVPPAKFVDAVQKNSPDLVGMSALLTTTMRAMDRTIKALKEAGLREQVKVMVGGAPVTTDFAKQIGADGYAANAVAAADMARQFMAR